jgi:hypothetical protein
MAKMQVAARLFRLIIDRVAAHPEQAALVAAARLDLVLALIHLGVSDELSVAISALHDLGSIALAPIDQMIARLEGVSGRRWDLAATLSNKIAILEQLDRPADSRAAIGKFLDQFGDDQSPHLRPLVAEFRQALAEQSTS